MSISQTIYLHNNPVRSQEVKGRWRLKTISHSGIVLKHIVSKVISE